MSPSPLASGKGLDLAWTPRPTGICCALVKENLRYQVRSKKTHVVSFPVGKNGRKGVEKVLGLFLEKKRGGIKQSSGFSTLFAKVILKDRCGMFPETRSLEKKYKKEMHVNLSSPWHWMQ